MLNILDNIVSGDGTIVRLDDLLALQELALVLEKILEDFNEPCILYGCVMSSTAITAGLVFLNGKVHILPATTFNFFAGGYIQFLSSTMEDYRGVYTSGTEARFVRYLAQVSLTPPASGQYI